MVQNQRARQQFSDRLLQVMDLRGWPARGRGARLASITGRTPKAASKWINAESMPGAGQMAAIAAALRVNRAWLEYGEGPRERGETVAEDAGPYSSEAPERVPLVDWEHAADEITPSLSAGWVLSPVAHSASARAVRVQGTSMAPRFSEHEVLIVDPAVTATPGRYVIAKSPASHEIILRQLVADGGRFFLQAENPAWPERIVPLGEEWQLCATVVAKFEAL